MICHIVDSKDWENAISIGYYTPVSLKTEGFIHCSTAEQVVDTANRFFPNQKGLLILCLDQSKIEAKTVFESPTAEHDPKVSPLFPHIYGKLNMSAVIKAVVFNPGSNGLFELPVEVKTLDKQYN